MYFEEIERAITFIAQTNNVYIIKENTFKKLQDLTKKEMFFYSMCEIERTEIKENAIYIYLI